MSSYNAPGNVQFNYAQLEGIWNQAGGSPGAAPIAAAIAMAESGGNSTATNQDSNGTVDRGLWQINSVHGAQSTYDVMGNARAAVAISNNGQNWSPWTTFNTGAYQRFLQANVAPDMSAPINGTNAAANATLTGDVFGIPIPGAPDIGPQNLISPGWWMQHILDLPGGAIGSTVDKGILTAVQGLISTILNPFINILAGVLGIAAGGAMVLFGIFMMVKSTEAGQEVGRAAGSAAQIGVSALAPETRAATIYRGAPHPQTGVRPTTTVTQRRRAPGSVRIGGRPIQYRPGRVQTEVEREGTGGRNYGDSYTAPGTRQQLVNEANGYNGKTRS